MHRWIVNPGLRSDKDVGRHGWEMTSVHTVLIRKQPSIKIPSGSTRPSSYNHTSVLDIFGSNLKFPPQPWLCCFLFHCLFLLHGLKHYSWYSYQTNSFFFFFFLVLLSSLHEFPSPRWLNYLLSDCSSYCCLFGLNLLIFSYYLYFQWGFMAMLFSKLFTAGF